MKEYFQKLKNIEQSQFYQFHMVLTFTFLLERSVLFIFGPFYQFNYNPTIGNLLIGMLHDFFWSFMLLSIGELLDHLIRLIRIKLNNLFKWIFALSSIILMYSLDQYFLTTSGLLTNMILMFNWDQLIDLLVFDKYISIARMVWIITLLVVFVLITLWTTRKLKIQRKMKWFLMGLTLLSMVLVISENPEYPNVYRTNKSFFFIHSLLNYQNERDPSGYVKFDDFKSLDPLFIGKKSLEKSSLLNKKWEQESQFAQFFHKTSTGKKPNLCIIIVESLSSSLVGQFAYKTGHVMPFLDSLAKESLYFPNTLSTAQRTHHVLPAILASLPHSRDHTCFQEEEYPNHVGIAKLTKSSHFSSFYCGIGLEFNQMSRFVNFNNFDYASNQYRGLTSNEKREISDFWGLPDHMMFREYLKEFSKRISDGYYKNKSALDILLTISTHEPFHCPDQKKHSKIVEGLLNNAGNSAFLSFLKTKIPELATYHYTDESLKEFFNHIKNTKEYQNTIFVITGDHRSTLLYENEMSKYHVPLLVYSPLLKRSKKINKVISHLDVAPTLMNFLRKEYHVEMPNQHSFLGKEIHFNRQEKRAFIFKGEDLKSGDVIYQDIALLNGKLFKLSRQLEPIPFVDDKKKKELVEQAEFMRLFNYYTVEQNQILSNLLVNNDGFMGRLIKEEEKSSEYIKLFELDVHELKGHKKGLMVDLRFEIEGELARKMPSLPVWLKTNSSKNKHKGSYEKLMFGRYITMEGRVPTKASIHFYISEQELARFNTDQKLVCFIHNTEKLNLPISRFKWKIH